MNYIMQSKYLTDIPQSMENYGLCKTFMVRYEVITYKHIMTEIFVRKTIPIEEMLSKIEMSILTYMENMTNKLRHIHNFSRGYTNDISKIIQKNRKDFFPTLQLYKGLNNVIVLDFDGVITSNKFKDLYQLCVERGNVIVCTANPTVSNDWFIKHRYTIPHKIIACKGKIQKIKSLANLGQIYDNIFYIDNEEEYLRYAWIFGIKTFQYQNGKIKQFSMCTK